VIGTLAIEASPSLVYSNARWTVLAASDNLKINLIDITGTV